MKTTLRVLAIFMIACTGLLLPANALADEPVLEEENQCPNPGGQGEQCATEDDCALNAYATICVQHVPGDPFSRKCEIPCEEKIDGSLNMSRSACAIGETCIEGKATPGRKAYYCKPSAFRVDLNLLDQAVVHHLEGLQPTFSEGHCSLEANLSSLLDQNGDKIFDIFDLDLCVLAFLEQPGCDLVTLKCEATDLVPCAENDDCGKGLYCDAQRHTCQRDCGIIAAREETFEDLERECTGALKVCNYVRGQCEKTDVTKVICETDSQCPAGAYCLVGRCAPVCYAASDCPGTDWYCTQNNRCRALPHPAADDKFEFDPRGYAVRFARDSLRLDAIQITDSSPLVIMNLVTKKQVVNTPSVTFGYRLEVSYGLKQDAKCLKPFVDCSNPESLTDGETEEECFTRQDDCYVDDTEQWLQFLSPFGTISAMGDTAMAISLDTAAADKLTPGNYSATVRAIFDNGDSDTVSVTLVKASPSGEYSGTLSVYYEGSKNLLNGYRPLQFGMRLKLTDETIQWNELMEANNIVMDDALIDLTEGRMVVGKLHGSSAFAFTRGDAYASVADEIPFVGIYSPVLEMIHMVGIIDVDKDFCITEKGDTCAGADQDELLVRNLFGRTIRRKIEFIGPFDEAQGLYHGLYREKISGLASAFDVTVEGGFRMVQILADDSDLELEAPLLPAWAGAVGYPTHSLILQQVQDDIDTYCGDGDALDKSSAAWAMAQFSSPGAFFNYLKQAQRSGDPNEYSVLGKTTVFPGLRQFNDIIDDALTALGTDLESQQEHLNIYDFVSSRLLPCEKDDPAPPPVCIDEEAVRCGLALHQKALLTPAWVNLDELKGTTELPVENGEQELFCIDTIALDGCPAEPGDARALFVLQEHNRFWRDLGQILKFDADRGRSDAFLVLFRNEIDPFAAGAALSYKSDRLREAMTRYDSLLETLVGPVAGKVLFRWPIAAFKQRGRDWLDIMQAVAEDRMGALADLVDLQRRVFAADTEFAFAHHMMQQEYLIQVYLMVLQEQWQQEQFAYQGEAAQLFETGQKVLNQLDPRRNSIGVQPQVTFFENSDATVDNWEHYRNLLAGKEDGGGLLGEADGQVGGAIENLQGALKDLDELEKSLMESKFSMEDKLAEICGDPDPGDPDGEVENYCQYLLKQYNTYEDWLNARNCKFEPGNGQDCPAGFAFECADYSNKLDGSNDCQDVVEVFTDSTDLIVGEEEGGDLIAKQPKCVLDKDQHYVKVNGVQRPCVGGAMGDLLQERALVELKRLTVIGSTETLLKQLNASILAFEEIYGLEENFAEQANIMNGVKAALDTVLLIGGTVKDLTDDTMQALGCGIIVGFAVGTDCPGKFIEAIGTSTAQIVWGVIKTTLESAKTWIDFGLAFAEKQKDLDKMQAEFAGELLTTKYEVDGLIDEFNVLTQTAFNLGAKMEDMRYQAQFSIDRYHDEVTFVADHLVGRESGYVLRGDALVQDASDTFRDILQYSYRMVMALDHHYNLSPGEAEYLTNWALSLVTLDDARELVEYIDKLAEEYCGKEAIDCDWDDPSNVKYLRFSLRENLFPSLHDIVDGKSGKVVTAGEQFHNMITQPPYVKRRIRGVMETDQLELPFGIPVTLMENTGPEPKWLINPLECNQHLAAGQWEAVPPWAEGTIAVNVIGHNLGEGDKVINFELVRGGMDFMRTCHPESIIKELGTLPVLEYPIRKHMISYAPQSTQGNQSTVPAFVIRSQEFSACLTGTEAKTPDELPCWHTFARDRALAAPDWKLVAPLVVGGGNTDNQWLMGHGLDDDEKPVIEDIVVYFRYYSRPIEETL